MVIDYVRAVDIANKLAKRRSMKQFSISRNEVPYYLFLKNTGVIDGEFNSFKTFFVLYYLDPVKLNDLIELAFGAHFADDEPESEEKREVDKVLSDRWGRYVV